MARTSRRQSFHSESKISSTNETYSPDPLEPSERQHLLAITPVRSAAASYLAVRHKYKYVAQTANTSLDALREAHREAVCVANTRALAGADVGANGRKPSGILELSVVNARSRSMLMATKRTARSKRDKHRSAAPLKRAPSPAHHDAAVH